MMRIVHHLDEMIWREFVMNNPRGNIFHSPEMYQVFARSKGFSPALWAVLDDDGAVQALMLTAKITVIGGIFQFMTTRAVVYGGPLCSDHKQGQVALDFLLHEYNRHAARNVLFTEFRNVHDVSDLRPTLENSGYYFEDHLNFLIDLTRPSQELWKNIRSNAQRNIRKAQKSGVTIEEAHTPEDVDAAYVILQDVYHRIQVPLPDRSLFTAAFEALHPKNMMHILFARLNGVNIGALTLLTYKGNILYWYTGPLREYTEYRAGDLLVWSAIEFGKKLNCHTFDFGGGGRPDEEYGVRDFKLKFGGQQVNFGRNVCVHAPTRLRVSEFGYSVLRRFL
ncbi:MAG TPA: GNAT family N-acetyltransferase [Anaerolineales bacterium]|nr:GNAT family N-acetyltransferase [Anaerolineales bacterium]